MRKASAVLSILSFAFVCNFFSHSVTASGESPYSDFRSSPAPQAPQAVQSLSELLIASAIAPIAAFPITKPVSAPVKPTVAAPDNVKPAINTVVPCPPQKANPTVKNKTAKQEPQQTSGTSPQNKNVTKKTRKVRPVEDLSTRIVQSCSPKQKTDPDEKWVSLTFDDGPSPDTTPAVLKLLKEHGIHATFCVIGLQVKKYPELVKQIAAEGHQLASHSMNHDERLSYRSDAKIRQEILGEKELIQSIVPDAAVDYYRAPAGNWNYHIRKLIASWGMKPLGWSVDSKDWQRPGTEAIIATVKKQLHDGGIVLMHDGGGNRSETLAALKKLIPDLVEDGYQFGFPQAN